MNIDFILPDIGEGIVECEIVKWNVKEGDVIAEDQSVVEVMTDKAVVEIPAKHSGTVHKLYYKQGDIAEVHSPLFALDTDESASESHQNSTEDPTAVATDDQAGKEERVNENKNHRATPDLSLLSRYLEKFWQALQCVALPENTRLIYLPLRVVAKKAVF